MLPLMPRAQPTGGISMVNLRLVAGQAQVRQRRWWVVVCRSVSVGQVRQRRWWWVVVCLSVSVGQVRQCLWWVVFCVSVSVRRW